MICAPNSLWAEKKAFTPQGPHVKKAYHFKNLTSAAVQCQTCPHGCVILPNKRGRCGTKINLNQNLYTISYGNPCAIHSDPIEKKPLYHFYPTTTAFSIAVAGCNFTCLNCQNWEISQTTPDKTRNYKLFPEGVVKSADQYKCKSIAYTYSEAITFYEYMVDTSIIARQKGLKNVWVSNGYITEQALEKLCDVIDAASINLKSFSDDIYLKLNGGHLDPVLSTLKILHRRKVWIEIINLIIPTYTDDMEMVRKMCDWIVHNIGPDYPLHFSRFFPKYRLVNLPPTPLKMLTSAKEIAQGMGLNHVYIGNAPGLGEDTYCTKCKSLVIQRKGYHIKKFEIKNGKCNFCKHPIPGRWDI